MNTLKIRVASATLANSPPSFVGGSTLGGKSDGEIITVREADRNGRENLLRTVFRNGEILVKDDFQVIRARAEGQIDEVSVVDQQALAA